MQQLKQLDMKRVSVSNCHWEGGEPGEGREPDQPGAVLQAGDPPPHAAAQAARHEESQCK